MTELLDILADWPVAASMAVALITVQGLRAGRRRSALNEALHELRRPLQALTLATGGGAPPAPRQLGSSVRLAAAALERLDREVNGRPLEPRRERLEARSLLAAAVGRWQGRATLGGGLLTLRWRAGEAAVEGDGAALAGALDNLIVNAIEHGGPAVAVEARLRGGRLRIAVADSGRAARPESRRETPAEAIARLAGRRRRGHGLAVVRRVAAAHGGRFALRRSESGSLAVLELPLAVDAPGGRAA